MYNLYSSSTIEIWTSVDTTNMPFLFSLGIFANLKTYLYCLRFSLSLCLVLKGTKQNLKKKLKNDFLIFEY